MKVQSGDLGGEAAKAIFGIPSVAAIGSIVPKSPFEDRIVDEDGHSPVRWCGLGDGVRPETQDRFFVEFLLFALRVSIGQRGEERRIGERRVAVADHDEGAVGFADSGLEREIGAENVERGAGRDDLHVACRQQREVVVDRDDLATGTGAVVTGANAHGDVRAFERALSVPGVQDQSSNFRGEFPLLRGAAPRRSDRGGKTARGGGDRCG